MTIVSKHSLAYILLDFTRSVNRINVVKQHGIGLKELGITTTIVMCPQWVKNLYL